MSLTTLACNVAAATFNNTNIDEIATELNTSKLEVIGAYKLLEAEGLATFVDGNVILSDEGYEMFAPTQQAVALENEIAEHVVKSKPQHKDISNLISEVGVSATITFKPGSRNETCHAVYTAKPETTKSELNKLLRAITGLPMRNCYVIQNGYEKAIAR